MIARTFYLVQERHGLGFLLCVELDCLETGIEVINSSWMAW